jgi:hypothetical protein
MEVWRQVNISDESHFRLHYAFVWAEIYSECDAEFGRGIRIIPRI